MTSSDCARPGLCKAHVLKADYNIDIVRIILKLPKRKQCHDALIINIVPRGVLSAWNKIVAVAAGGYSDSHSCE